MERSGREAAKAERLQPRLRTVEDVGGGERSEGEHLVCVPSIENRIRVLEHVVKDRVAVGGEPDDAAVRLGLPAPFGAAEAGQHAGKRGLREVDE